MGRNRPFQGDAEPGRTDLSTNAGRPAVLSENHCASTSERAIRDESQQIHGDQAVFPTFKAVESENERNVRHVFESNFRCRQTSAVITVNQSYMSVFEMESRKDLTANANLELDFSGSMA